MNHHQITYWSLDFNNLDDHYHFRQAYKNILTKYNLENTKNLFQSKESALHFAQEILEEFNKEWPWKWELPNTDEFKKDLYTNFLRHDLSIQMIQGGLFREKTTHKIINTIQVNGQEYYNNSYQHSYTDWIQGTENSYQIYIYRETFNIIP